MIKYKLNYKIFYQQNNYNVNVMLPDALGSRFHSPPHGETATSDVSNLADELIGLLQGGLAGEC